MSIININGMVFYIFLLSIVVSKSNISKIYRIPFAQHNYEYISNKSANYSNIVESIFFNVIYINLFLGNPPQKIPFHLNIYSQAFYTIENYFMRNKSNTYESISYIEKEFDYSDLKKGYLSKDYIYINEANNDNNKSKVEFIYGTEVKQDANLGNIGLLIPDNKKNNAGSTFISSLKKSDLINSYSWTIKYYNDINLLDTIYTYGKEGKYIGEFIIGDDPHNYELDKNIYDENKLMKVNAISDFDGIYWGIFFNDIYMKTKNNEINNNTDIKEKIYGNREADINPDLGFIAGPNEFFSLIHKNFFNKYKKICKEKQVNNTLFKYIECEKNSTLNISSFPDIFFESKSLETTFNLTYKDLFIFDKINNKYIFLIMNNRYVSRWIFGSIFLRKYQFVFNPDSKTIGYYKSMNDYKNNFIDENKYKNIDIIQNKKIEENNITNINQNINAKKENENIKQYIIYLIIGILFVIFSILFIFLGIFIQRKCLNYRRRKRVNELEDVDNDMEKNNNLIV